MVEEKKSPRQKSFLIKLQNFLILVLENENKNVFVNFQIKKVTLFSITGHLRPLHSGCEVNEQHENTKCLDVATERQEKQISE